RDHRLADEAYVTFRQRRMARRLQIRQLPGAGDRAELGDFFGGVDRDHAWCAARGANVDFGDLGVGMRRAHEDAVQQSGQAQIVNVMAYALDQARIFFALHSSANVPLNAGSSSVSSAVPTLASQGWGTRVLSVARSFCGGILQCALRGHLAGS